MLAVISIAYRPIGIITDEETEGGRSPEACLGSQSRAGIRTRVFLISKRTLVISPLLYAEGIRKTRPVQSSHDKYGEMKTSKAGDLTPVPKGPFKSRYLIDS